MINHIRRFASFFFRGAFFCPPPYVTGTPPAVYHFYKYINRRNNFMADIRIEDLPERGSPQGTDLLHVQAASGDDYSVAASDLLDAVRPVDSEPAASSVNPVASGGVHTALAGKQDALTFDDVPVENSNNPVKSGGLYTLLSGLGDNLDNIIRAIHSIPRAEPKDLSPYVADGTFWKRIAGTDDFSLFDDIYVGDYIHMSRAISAYERTGTYQETGSEYVTIADLDGAWGRGDTNPINYHHAIMVPGKGLDPTEKQHFGRSRMNSGNDTTGGYVSSEMNSTTIGAVASSGSTASTATINQQLYAEFGSHLKTVRELLSNGINSSGYNRFGSATGCSNNWTWTSVQAVLLSEIEVYGSIVWSSSGYDTGSAVRQLALFQQSEVARNNRSAYCWLKDVASAANFCYAGNNGNASYSYASGASSCVRPRFIIA